MYSQETLYCAGCGTEIIWSPFLLNELKFCCQDCAQSIVCKCRETMDWQNEYRNGELSLPTAYSNSQV